MASQRHTAIRQDRRSPSQSRLPRITNATAKAACSLCVVEQGSQVASLSTMRAIKRQRSGIQRAWLKSETCRNADILSTPGRLHGPHRAIPNYAVAHAAENTQLSHRALDLSSDGSSDGFPDRPLRDLEKHPHRRTGFSRRSEDTESPSQSIEWDRHHRRG